MISEVDLRDWDKVDFKPFEKDATGNLPLVPHIQFIQFVNSVHHLKLKQFQGTQPRVPALLQKREA